MTKQTDLLEDQGSFSTMGSSKLGTCYLLPSNTISTRPKVLHFKGVTEVLYCFQARGIDVQQVSLVINYDLPTNRENYIHR